MTFYHKKNKSQVTLTYESSEDEADVLAADEVEDGSGQDEADESGADESSSDEGGEGTETGNKGWADAMSKVLHAKKSLILVKAKKDKDVKKKDKTDAEKAAEEVHVVDEKGNVRIMGPEEKNKAKKGVEEEVEEEDRMETHDEGKKREWEEMGRIKPDPRYKERELMLSSIATKGVVQLFNAVKQQQQMIKEKLREAGPSERKKDKALASFSKSSFLDMLKTQGEEKVNGSRKATKQGKRREDVEDDDEDSEEDEQQGDKKGWKVLRDDFMLDVKIKDWDKEGESADEEMEMRGE